MKFIVPPVLSFYLCRTVPPTPKYFHTFRFFFLFLHNFLCFLNSCPSCLWSLPVCALSSEWSLSLIQAPNNCPCFVIFFLFCFETGVEICFRNLWNGCRHPFRYFFFGFSVKQISKSASGICEPDVNIRFLIFFSFFLKQMSKFASRICETDFDIHFDICFLFFLKWISKSVSRIYETDFEIRLVFFFFNFGT